MAGILVYALHDDEGNFNKNSQGAISEAARLAGELGTHAAALVVGDVSDEGAQSLGAYGATKVYRAKNVPEGLAQPIVDAMAKVIADEDYDYVLFGGGLLGFEIGAGLTARLGAGVTMEVTEVRVQDGGLVAVRPILQDSQVADVGYVGKPGIIIGRLNAFDATERDGGSAEVVDVDVELSPWSTKATMVTRGEQRGEDVNIEDADFLVAGGRGLGKAENFAPLRRAGEGARRRGCGNPRGRGRGLVPVRGPDRPDRQDRRAEAVSRGGHLGRDPAQGRHAGLGEHRRDQQGPERADLRVLRPRHRGRPAQDHAQADRRREGEEGRVGRACVA